MNDKCYKCGATINHYEEIEQLNDNLTMLYVCDKCGFKGEQHFNIIYSHTVEM